MPDQQRDDGCTWSALLVRLTQNPKPVHTKWPSLIILNLDRITQHRGSSTYSQIDDWGKQATYPKPYAVALLAGEEPVKVVCGFYTTYVLTASGKVLARGRGDSGEIGILPSDLELNQDFRRVASTFRVVPLVTPTMVVTSRVLDVAAGGQHACALVSQTTRRDVFCWGRNPKRELGQPTTTTSTHVPTRVRTQKQWKRRVTYIYRG